ncbi:MAG: DinB family protein, partial [Chitinophagaceae bacterium]
MSPIKSVQKIMGMKTCFPYVIAICIGLFAKTSIAQSPELWKEKDRRFLIENLERTRNEVIGRCTRLSPDQWRFKPDSASWSIAQVVEHLGLYERIFIQEADIMLSADPDPALDSLSSPDSVYI